MSAEYESKFAEEKSDLGEGKNDVGDDLRPCVEVKTLDSECNGMWLPLTSGFDVDICFAVGEGGGGRIRDVRWVVDYRYDAMDATKVLRLLDEGDEGARDYDAGEYSFRHKFDDIKLTGVKLKVFKNIMGIVAASLQDKDGEKLVEVNFVVQTRRTKFAPAGDSAAAAAGGGGGGGGGGGPDESMSHVERSKNGKFLYVYERMLIVPDVEES